MDQQKPRIKPWQMIVRSLVVVSLVVPLHMPDHPNLPLFLYDAVRIYEWTQEPPSPMPPEIAEMERVASGH